MTLWNPLNVFSGRAHSAADGPSASFDPSRTGDPLGPRPSDPAIGIGGTQIGGPVSTGDPRRHPIGFAPPADQDAEPRFRTEISFKRHHELPRASTTPVFPEDGVQSSWQSPEQVGSVDGEQVDRSTLDQVDAVELLRSPRRAFRSSSVRSASAARRRTPAKRSRPRRPRTTRRRSGRRALDDDATDEATEATESGRFRRSRSLRPLTSPRSTRTSWRSTRIVAADEPETLVVAEAVSSEDDAERSCRSTSARSASVARRTPPRLSRPPRSCDAVGDEDTSDAVGRAGRGRARVRRSSRRAGGDRGSRRRSRDSCRGADVAEDDAAAELFAAEPQVEDDAPALEIVPVHELDRARHGRRGARGSALRRHHGARVAHRGRHARARRIRARHI